MKYISQLNGFWNWVRTNGISHLEVDLYLSILDVANASSWKTHFTIPNSTLGRFDKNSLNRARNKLVQYGLIKYDKGKKGQAGVYSVKKLYKEEGEKTFYPIFDTNIDTNTDTNSDTNMQPIQGTYIDKDKDKNRILTPYIPFESPLREKVVDWLRYKSERGQRYKETGLKSLFAKIQANLDKYGQKRVIEAIEYSMANNYQGLFFDKNSVGEDSGIYSDDYDHEALEELTRRRG